MPPAARPDAAIARLVTTDVSGLAPLLRRADPEFLKSRDQAETSLDELLRDWASRGRAHAFLCRCGDRTVGFVTARLEPDPRAVTIGPLYVLPEARGRGLGRRLFELLLQWAQARGFERVRSRTWAQNRASLHIHEGLGFQVVSEEPDHRVNGDSTVYLEYRFQR